MLCAACKQEITDNAKFCLHCGAPVSSSIASPATKQCPQCGAENAITAKFCRVDGFRFDGAQPTATTAQAHLETARAAAASATQVPPSEMHPARPAEQAAGSVVCPQCGTVNRPGATFCKTDGFRLADSTSGASELALGSVACPTCGTKNVPGAKFCRKDGTPLAGPAETPPPTRLSSPQPALRVGADSTATSRAPIRPADPARVAPPKSFVPVVAVILITLAGAGGGFLYWRGVFGDRHLAIQEALNARLQAQGLAGVKAMVRKDFTADVTGTVSTSDQKQKALDLVREEKSLTRVVENINVPPTVGETAKNQAEEERRAAEEARPGAPFAALGTKASPTEVADIPDVRVGDTYLVDSQYPNNAKLNNMTERKVVSVIDGGVTVASRNVKSRSGQSRMLRYTQEWNLVSSRNADGSGMDYLPPLKYFEFPLYPGKSWRQTSRETNVKTGATRDFTLSATVGEWENISVPAGTFRGIKITSQTEIVDRVSGQRSTGTDVSWYAPDIRRSVRSVITSRNMQGYLEDQFIHVAQYQVNR